MKITQQTTVTYEEPVADLGAEFVSTDHPRVRIRDALSERGVVCLIGGNGIFVSSNYGGKIATGKWRMVKIQNLKDVIENQATPSDIPEDLKASIVEEFQKSLKLEDLPASLRDAAVKHACLTAHPEIEKVREDGYTQGHAVGMKDADQKGFYQGYEQGLKDAGFLASVGAPKAPKAAKEKPADNPNEITVKRPYIPKDLPVEYQEDTRKTLTDTQLGIIVAVALIIALPIYCLWIAEVLAS